MFLYFSMIFMYSCCVCFPTKYITMYAAFSCVRAVFTWMQIFGLQGGLGKSIYIHEMSAT